MNPLLSGWFATNGTLPPFDRIRIEDFEPALTAAMDQRRQSIEHILRTFEPATFPNTMIPLERSSRAFDAVVAMYRVWTQSLSTGEVRHLERNVEPALAAFEDELIQNDRLFQRIKGVYGAADHLPAEQRRLTWHYHDWFAHRGAGLASSSKQRLAEINRLLAALTTQFQHNLLLDEQTHPLVITDEQRLAGLSKADIDAGRAEAVRAGCRSAWVFPNTRSVMEMVLTKATRRDVREQAWRLWTQRCDNGDEFDNNEIVTKIVALRVARARLLKFRSHAHWKLRNKMAADPENATRLMREVWSFAVARVTRDIAAMQRLADNEESPFRISPWDFRHYAEKLRKSKYDLDLDEVRPYLRLDRVRDVMFWVARRLFGLEFRPLHGAPVFHPDVSVYEAISDRGYRSAVFYFDPYARPAKRSGAWMSTYRTQSRLDGADTAIVANTLNFARANEREIPCISWNDAVALFHEFGHALHAILSDVTYPSLASPNTLDDFGEFPSQLLEHWLMVPEVLMRLVNAAGEPFPKALINRIRQSRKSNEAFVQTEYLASALADMRLHADGECHVSPREFERMIIADLGVPDAIVMRHRIPHFAHAFAGETYAAGYYDYLWAAVLEHDAFEAFVEAGDTFDFMTAQRLQSTIFAVGNTIDPGEAFRNFRGRDPQIGAFLRAKGFLEE